MKPKAFLKKEKKIWHKHFIPSLVAGVAVAFISFILEATLGDIILFASVGASAVILSNSRSHHLTNLRTAIIAYILSIIIAIFLYTINIFINLHISIYIFLIVFLVGISMYLLNAVHPPAISAAIAFILFQKPIIDLLYLIITIFVLLVLIRLITYVLSQHLSIKEFLNEFRKHV